MKTFIVPFIESIVKYLKWFSFFGIIRWLFKKYEWPSSYGFVDCWVLAHLLLSVTILYVYDFLPYRWLQWSLLFLAALRVIELTVYQVSVLLVDPFTNSNYAIGGYRRLLVLSLMNYFEILTWFGVFYHHWADWFKDIGAVLQSSTGALYFSLVTMSTLGYGEVTPLNDKARGLVSIQTMVGIFLVVIMISRIISYLPRPQTLDENENGNVD